MGIAGGLCLICSIEAAEVFGLHRYPFGERVPGAQLLPV
jgi:hypothetical protein